MHVRYAYGDLDRLLCAYLFVRNQLQEGERAILVLDVTPNAQVMHKLEEAKAEHEVSLSHVGAALAKITEINDCVGLLGSLRVDLSAIGGLVIDAKCRRAANVTLCVEPVSPKRTQTNRSD